jgi:spermidine/putrescine transport system ATP-binding protein
MSGGAVQLVSLEKRYSDVIAVDRIDLVIEPGEFFSLLGPSGCGKTTTLRLIAGFERPTSGEVRIDGIDMSHTPPHDRPVNTVFQSYALFPHLKVADNVGFGLRYLGVTKGEAKERIGRALDLVQLSGLEERKPNQLSGGQQQRVALARSLVLNPSVLLLDEPLGALDAKLRKALQVELKALQERVGITFVYVTHDQEEALTMSDRMAVMSHGHIEQVGPPADVYEHPSTAYIADFLGASNLMPALAAGRTAEGGCAVTLAGHSLVAGEGDLDASGEVEVCIRPERVLIERGGSSAPNALPGTIERVVYVGPALQVFVDLGDVGTIQVSTPNAGSGVWFAPGDAVTVRLPKEALRVLAAEHADLSEVVEIL